MKAKKVLMPLILGLLLIAALTFGLVGCNKLKGLVSPQNLKYNDSVLSWDSVAAADHYTVQINGGEKRNTSANSYAYNAHGQAFDVTIGAAIGNSEKTISRRFTPLGTVESFTVSDEGKVSWQAVENANGYLITLNGTQLDASVADTSFDALQVGNNTIKVKAIVQGDDSYFSSWSDEKFVSILGVPKNIKYDGDYVTWTASGNPTSYVVTINGVEKVANEARLQYNSGNKDFEVSVKAIGNHTSVFDSSAASDSFQYLDPVTNVKVSEGDLVWDASAGASGYKIKIDGVIISETLTENKYEKLTAGKSLAVSVMPVAEGNFFSSWTASKNVYVLRAPTVRWNADLELDGEARNNLVWDAVNAADGYAVKITKDGKTTTEEISKGQLYFENAYLETGIYTIEVRAKAPVGSDYYDSKPSAEVSVERLAAPTPFSNNYIVSDRSDIKKGFTATFNKVAGASGYQMYKDGVLMEAAFGTGNQLADANVIAGTVTEQQNINYIIRSMGSATQQNGKWNVKLASLTDKSLAFEITVLAEPGGLNMDGFYAKWSAASGNNGYTVNTGASSISADSENLNLSTLKAGTYNVKVASCGNGAATLPSNYSPAVKVIRLEAPTGIKITAGTGEGLLKFNEVSNATSYQTYINLSETPLQETGFDNMYQYISEKGTVIHMVAVANKYNDLKTEYYMTSESSPTVQFIRLSAPTFSEGAFANSTEFIWNQSANINTAEYTPSYEVTIDNTSRQGEKNSTKINIETLEGGKEHTFRVKAKGNDVKYLDSEYSDVKRIYKLATPGLSVMNDAYTWSGVTNGNAYALYIDGVQVKTDIHVSGNVYTYVPNFDKAKVYNIKLIAVGDGGKTTINSAAREMEQTVRTLLAPEIECAYSADRVTNGGLINVNVTVPSENARGYLYEIAGESSPTITDTHFEKQMESAGKYAVRVKAIGGSFDDNGICYIDSQFAGGNDSYTIVLLAPPSVGSFSLNSDGAVKWTPNTDASGYDYYFAFDNDSYPATAQHSGSASLNPIENYTAYHQIRLKVCARGNGGKTVSSAWVEYIWTNPQL